MPMRQEDGVTAFRLELRLGAARVPVQARVDVDPLPAWRVDAERRVPEPRELSSHAGQSSPRDEGSAQNGRDDGGVAREVEDRLDDDERADGDDERREDRDPEGGVAGRRATGGREAQLGA